MILAKVIGTVVATIKSPGLEGVKFLIVQPLDKHLQPKGQPVVAADGVAMAGPGEIVYVVGAREAALALPEKFVPVDHAIVGIVDEVKLGLLVTKDEGRKTKDDRPLSFVHGGENAGEDR